MTLIRVVALPTEVAESVRNTMRAPHYGHPAHAEIASGHGPCRHCLRTFTVGVDRRILFTYDQFDGVELLTRPGPVFVHAEPCQRYSEDGGFPADLRPHALTLDAYARGRRLLRQVQTAGNSAEHWVEELLASADVDYLHVSDTEAGCYDFRIEREDRPITGTKGTPAIKC